MHNRIPASFNAAYWVLLVLLILGAVPAISAETTPQETNATQLAPDCSTVTAIPIAECNALFSLYVNTGGNSWDNNSGWTTDNNPCNWYGITCQDGRVYQIFLNDNNLNGPLPGSIGSLPKLQAFSLTDNNITGSIPTAFQFLNDLQYLWMSNNALSGPIPKELGSMDSILVIHIMHNDLNGDIPAELGNLSTLIDLRLAHNELTGEIPVTFGNMSNLAFLVILDNNMSGPLPTEMGGLSNLVGLYINKNAFAGDIPESFVNLDLQEFNFSETFLCVTSPDINDWINNIPDWLGNGGACIVPTAVGLSSADTTTATPQLSLVVFVGLLLLTAAALRPSRDN